jgi:hypothetical protein
MSIPRSRKPEHGGRDLSTEVRGDEHDPYYRSRRLAPGRRLRETGIRQGSLRGLLCQLVLDADPRRFAAPPWVV